MLSRRAVLGAWTATALSAGQSKDAMFADAEAYDRFMGRWSAILAPMLVDFAGFPTAGRILDIGSGTGSLASAIAAKRPGCTVTGIDPSKEYTAYAASRNGAERVSFRVGDAQKIDFPDGAFDGCGSLLVWNFIPDSRRALSEAIRVCKAGAPIAAAVWDYSGGMRMLRAYWEAAVALDNDAERLDEARMPLCRAGQLAELWRSAGLRDVKDAPLDFTMRFSSFADYWDPFLLGQGPAGAYARRLDAGARAALRKEVKRRLGVADEKASVALPARAWAVVGSAPG